MPEDIPQPAPDSSNSPPTNHDPSPDASEAAAAERTRQRLRLLPPEVGAVLMTVGVAGLILPGPWGTPFILAGGLILAPRYFHRVELWVQNRFPAMHRTGRHHVDRFIDDFEKRYPRHPRR
jgi:hypothetical protein